MGQGKLLAVIKRPGEAARTMKVSPELHELKGALDCEHVEYVRMGPLNSFVVWCSAEATAGSTPEKDGKPAPWLNIRNPQDPDGDVIFGSVLALGNDGRGNSISLTADAAVEVINSFQALAITEAEFTPLKSSPPMKHEEFRKVANTHPLFCTCIICGFAD